MNTDPNAQPFSPQVVRYPLICLLCLTFTTTCEAVVVFDADFNGSTAVTGSVSANADAVNLNAGTTVGTWTTSGAGNPGAIISDGSGNNAFVFDNVVSGDASNRARGGFSSSVDLAGGTGLTLDFDIRASRQGGTDRQIRLSLDDASNTKGYVLIFRENGQSGGQNTKSFSWLTTDNTQTVVTTNVGGPNTGFNNPGVDNYSPDSTIGVTLEVIGQSTLSDPGSDPPATGAFLTLDWDNDGMIEASDGDLSSIPIGPRTGDVTELSSLELFYGGSGSRGAYLDNFMVDTGFVSAPIPGDVDGDGIVEAAEVGALGDDLGPIIANFFSSVSSREEGDLVAPFGFVDFADFREWKDNVPGGTALSLSQLLSVPEPTSCVLLMGASLALVARPRNRRFAVPTA